MDSFVRSTTYEPGYCVLIAFFLYRSGWIRCTSMASLLRVKLFEDAILTQGPTEGTADCPKQGRATIEMEGRVYRFGL